MLSDTALENKDPNNQNANLQVPVTSGDPFPETGYYKYAGHVDDDYRHCFIPEQAHHMIFDKNEKAPLLGSCPHKVKWTFVGRYEIF